MADNKPTTSLETYRPALAEFFATTLFVWCGCGTAVSMQSIPVFFDIPIDGSFLMTIALAFGLAIAVLVYAIAPISGGHVNPAVTFAFVICGKMPIVTGIRYIAAQCLGAFLGAALVWGCTASDLLTDSKSFYCIIDDFRCNLNCLISANLVLV
jgi:glycerol uptake facilitator-like aquaporin